MVLGILLAQAIAAAAVFMFRILAGCLMKAGPIVLLLLLAGCSGENGTQLPVPTFATITCMDAKGIGPDMDFLIGDPNVKVICINHICFPTPTSPISECLYGCGPDEIAAGMFSPCPLP